MRYLLPSLIIILFYACQIPVSLINAHEWSAFKLYKENNNSATNIKLDGFYYTTSDTLENCLVLYADGSFYADNIGQSKMDSAHLVEYFEGTTKARSAFFTYSSGIGIYRIKHDSIFFQSFAHKEPGVFGKKALCTFVVQNLIGTIKNDSTLLLTNYDCPYCWQNGYPDPGTKLSFTPPKEFKFYFTNGNKPDSSRAWYNKKRWYKKAVAVKD